MPKPRRRPPVSADRGPRPEPWSALLLAALVLSGCSGGDTGEISSEDRGRRLGTGWVESFAWTGNGTVAYAVETPVNEVRVIEVSEGSASVLTGVSTQFLRAPGAAGRVWYASGTAVLQVTADGSTSPDTVWSWASTGSGDFVRSFAVSEDEQILVVGKDELSGPNYVLPPVHVDLSTGDTMTVGTEWLRPVAVSPGGTRLLAFAQATEQESAMGYEWVVVEFGTGSVTRSGVGIAGPAGTEAEAVDFRWRWEGEDPVIAYLEDETLRERNLRSGSSTTLGTLPHAP